jgi:transposase
MKEFVTNTMKYLEEYYKRENSEAGFSADKKTLGWGIAQRRQDRLRTVHHWIVAQPVQPEFTLGFCPTAT